MALLTKLNPGTVTDADSGAVVATCELDQSQLSGELAATLIATNVGGTTPSFPVDIEHSPDGVNWAVLNSFTTVTGNGTELDTITAPRHHRLRLKLGTVTDADETADLICYISGGRSG